MKSFNKKTQIIQQGIGQKQKTGTSLKWNCEWSLPHENNLKMSLGKYKLQLKEIQGRGKGESWMKAVKWDKLPVIT